MLALPNLFENRGDSSHLPFFWYTTFSKHINDFAAFRKLKNLYSSTNITRAIKSKRITWANHVACTRRKEITCEVTGVNGRF
jgi:hypothetical protein